MTDKPDGFAAVPDSGRGLGREFSSPCYLAALLCTLTIFLLGFKWTLLGMYMLPYVFNPFVYICLIVFWLYYNFVWLRTALYLPASIALALRSYNALGVKISFWRALKLALCKADKIRKEDLHLLRAGGLVRVLARSFMKHGILLNFPRNEAERLSTAVFIHNKRKVFLCLRRIVPYLAPAFIAVLILTPTTFFLSSFNYRYLIEKFTAAPLLTGFWIYLAFLPFGFIWIFLTLRLLIVNMLGPLVNLPEADLYAQYLLENKINIAFDKPQRPAFESIMAVLMLCASAAFYVSTILGQCTVLLEGAIGG
ncbi:MAG: hypothetical protein LBL61_05905 [Elusimicrobiota bacterium]|jgi:hypothetical protein|nr:hypothetical protein [Elusimicrobiota bacterium]